ncbi:MAG: DEAD/DEAH box helicase [Desulfurococcales archaeon]|nr:DEAD/DEAH box helicase [Desulfurococcales archaeon]
MGISGFESLHPRLAAVIRRLGYKRPYPVQSRSFPVILSGTHTLIVAPTGSGKTEASMFPILSMMAEKGVPKDSLKVVYITPLRALNRDIGVRLGRIVKEAGFTILVRHGDTPPSERKRFLKEPPNVMVTTPESLNMILTLPEWKHIWRSVEWVVVDEIHELLDNERGAEVSVILERLQRASSKRIQRIGLSATLSRASMREAAGLLAHGRRVAIVEDPTVKRYTIEVEVPGGNSFEDALDKLVEVLKKIEGSTIIFTNTRATAEHLGVAISRKLGEGLYMVHHGSLSREIREKAEKSLREGKIRGVIATSSMELGIDIGHVDKIVQFASPRQAIVLVQRVGRSGHSLGKVSRGVIVALNNLFEILESGVLALRAERGHLEDLKHPKKPLDALAHQLVAMVIEGSARTISEAHEILASTLHFSDITREEVEEVANHLGSVGVLRVEGEGLRQGRRARSYFYRVTMIPDDITYSVIDVVTKKKVGEVSERFVETVFLSAPQNGGEKKARFVLAGSVWEIVSVEEDPPRIYVAPIGVSEGYTPVWEGELIPVDYKVAREVCSILELLMVDEDAGRRLLSSRKLPRDSIEHVVEIARKTKSSWGGKTLSHKEVVIEESRDLTILYTCLGSKGNYALALLLSKILESSERAEFRHIPYAIVFTGYPRLAGESVRRALEEAKRLDPAERAALVYDSIRSTRAYLMRFLHVAKRMGVVDPSAPIPVGSLRKTVEAYKDSVVDRETVKEIVHDKLDLEALNSFLDSLEKVSLVRVKEPSALALEVLSNPYLKRDLAVNIKTIAMDKIADYLKKRLDARNVLLQCVMCGESWTTSVSTIKTAVRCRKCGSMLVAPLPDTEWGRETSYIYKIYKQGSKLSSEHKKRVREVLERGQLYLNYASQGLGNYVVKALMAQGVGPKRAKRIMDSLLMGGELRFYSEILKAEEEYLANRKYWSV